MIIMIITIIIVIIVRTLIGPLVVGRLGSEAKPSRTY